MSRVRVSSPALFFSPSDGPLFAHSVVDGGCLGLGWLRSEADLSGDLVERTHALGMPIYTYTARVETAEGDVASWFRRLIETGVDGIFADQPLELIKVRDAL